MQHLSVLLFHIYSTPMYTFSGSALHSYIPHNLRLYLVDASYVAQETDAGSPRSSSSKCERAKVRSALSSSTIHPPSALCEAHGERNR